MGISNLFLFDGEQVKELADQDVPPPVVVEAIRALLGLELAERLSVDIDILVNRKRKALADAQELVTLEEIEQKLIAQQEEYQTAKQAIASVQNNLEQAQEQQRQASERFLSEGGKIAGERSQLETQLRYSHEAAAAQRQAMSDSLAGILPLVLISPILTQAFAQGQKEYRHQQAKIAQDVLKERDQRLLNCITQLELPPEKVDKIKLFLDQQNRELEQNIGSDEESWLGVDAETLNQLDNILHHYLATHKATAVEPDGVTREV